MKRFVFALVAIICVLCVCFSACQSNEEDSSILEAEGDVTQLPQLNLCIDLGTNAIGTEVSNMLNALPGSWEEFVVLSETVPYEGPQRENTLTRLRTEILAGKGPDVFLCANTWFWTYQDTRALFPFPEKAMQNRIFLPLDSYIENAQYMEWDKQLPVVMEAGRNEEGQMLVPMLFNIRMTLFPKEDHVLTAQLPMTWDEMKDSSDRMVRYAAVSASLGSIFGPLADYKKDAPTFTEEELLKRANELWELQQEEKRGEYPEFTEYVEEFDIYRTTEELWQSSLFGFGVGTDVPKGDCYMIPSYNEEGGVTAQIEVFAGINRNTKMPEQAFRLLDFMMGEKQQQNSILLTYSNGCLPHIELGQKGKRLAGKELSDWNFEQYSQVLQQINTANFYTEANDQLWPMIFDAVQAGETMESAVHEAYTMISMLLAES